MVKLQSGDILLTCVYAVVFVFVVGTVECGLICLYIFVIQFIFVIGLVMYNKSMINLGFVHTLLPHSGQGAIQNCLCRFHVAERGIVYCGSRDISQSREKVDNMSDMITLSRTFSRWNKTLFFYDYSLWSRCCYYRYCLFLWFLCFF